MARYKPYDYRQTKMLPVRFEEQILPGTFEYTLNRLIDESIDLTVFEARYRSDDGGAPRARELAHDFAARQGSLHAGASQACAIIESMTARTWGADLAGLLGWLLAAFAAAAIGAIASLNAPTFYADLSKPPWAPPAEVFGPVWTVLYLLMGFSAWLVWREPRPSRGALVLFGVQLVANALWSWLFFAWHRGALATVEVLVLLVLIAATVRAFWQTSRLAAFLLLPYLLWVSFASALTWAVWQRNPGLL